MTHTPTLKPCPFCGEQPLVAEWTVGCNNEDCGVSVEALGGDHQRRAEQWNTRTEAIEAGAVQGVIAAAEKLSNAERGYRLCHDVKGDGHIETGSAWDYMRKCGDELRIALSQLAEASK